MHREAYYILMNKGDSASYHVLYYTIWLPRKEILILSSPIRPTDAGYQILNLGFMFNTCNCHGASWHGPLIFSQICTCMNIWIQFLSVNEWKRILIHADRNTEIFDNQLQEEVTDSIHEEQVNPKFSQNFQTIINIINVTRL